MGRGLRWSSATLIFSFFLPFFGLLAQVNPALENFSLVRDLLRRPAARAFLKEAFKQELIISEEDRKRYEIEDKVLKEISETQVLLLVEAFPEFRSILVSYLAEAGSLDAQTSEAEARRQYWKLEFTKILSDPGLRAKFQELNDPLEPYELKTPVGEFGYRNLRLYVNHARRVQGVDKPADDLKKVWLDFIAGTTESLAFNVFDFDLMEVAEALVQKRAQGVEIFLGVDDKVIDARAEVRAVVDYLRSKGVNVVGVDSPGLNHQKMAVRDWKISGKAAVLLSSGNLTQSCIGPEGDLKDVKPRPKISIPNANHTITLESDGLAAVVHHELVKTLQSDFLYRGRTYPLSGAFKISGPPSTAGGPTYLVIGFSPRGALNNINKNMIARILSTTTGRVRLAQFAFSSYTTLAALLERAKAETKNGKKFDFASVGDTPFAMAEWSNFLKMSGFKREDKLYVEDPESAWRAAFSEDDYKDLLSRIRIAPPEFGTRKVRIAGVTYDLTAKIHHKVMTSGPVSIIGTSFNFSTGAENNNEQLVAIFDPALADEVSEMVDALVIRSRRSVYQEAHRRKQFQDVETPQPQETLLFDSPPIPTRATSRWAACKAIFARTGNMALALQMTK